MPKQSITLEFISSLAQHLPAKGAICYFDHDLPGFMLEHRMSGGATYYFRYRDPTSRVRLCRIGNLREVELGEARSKAYQLRQLLQSGGDPKRELHRFSKAPLLVEFIQKRYEPYVVSRKRSWKLDMGMLSLHVLPTFGKVRMNSISSDDVRRLHQGMREKGYAPSTCNRVLVMLQHVFNCAIRFEILSQNSNPCKQVKKFEAELKDRYLSRDEVKALFCELDRNPNVMVGQIIRLLLYTGARKRELMDAKWSEIDFEKSILWVPAERSKSRRPRPIALSRAAVDLLKSLPRDSEVPYVFFNIKTRKPPVSIFVAWNSIRRKVGLDDVRLHDLRHSYASFLVNAGRSLYEVQNLLGHQDPKVTMRYSHLTQTTMVEAANAVVDILFDV